MHSLLPMQTTACDWYTNTISSSPTNMAQLQHSREPLLARVGLHAPALVHGCDGQVGDAATRQHHGAEVAVLAVRVPAGSQVHAHAYGVLAAARSWSIPD